MSEELRICETLTMEECNHRGKYLGSPFCRFKSKNCEFNFLAEKMASKLSMVGRLTLIKSVLSTCPSYTMQVFMLTSNLCDKLDRINHRFF